MNEANIQQNIIIWFRNNYSYYDNGLIFSVPNESSYGNKKFNNTGVLSGVSDLIVVLNNKVLFIEVKTDKGLQSEKQREFEKKVKALGHSYFLVRSLDDFKKCL